MITETGARYPFIIMNTDDGNKKAHIGGGFLIYKKKKEIFLFRSFGLEGFKEFILQDDRKTLNKILYRIKRFEKKGNYNNFDFFHEQI